MRSRGVDEGIWVSQEEGREVQGWMGSGMSRQVQGSVVPASSVCAPTG